MWSSFWTSMACMGATIVLAQYCCSSFDQFIIRSMAIDI